MMSQNRNIQRMKDLNFVQMYLGFIARILNLLRFFSKLTYKTINSLGIFLNVHEFKAPSSMPPIPGIRPYKFTLGL